MLFLVNFVVGSTFLAITLSNDICYHASRSWIICDSFVIIFSVIYNKMEFENKRTTLDLIGEKAVKKIFVNEQSRFEENQQMLYKEMKKDNNIWKSIYLSKYQ